MTPEEKNRKLSFRLGLIGLACPLGLILIIVLMRAGVFTFHDDFTGYKALGFFLLWAMVLLTSGLLSSAVAIALNRRTVSALLGFVVNFGFFLFVLLRLV